ncbi:hypothetical protein EV360DRAFT_72858 [Lentinula raphanica]|nr:hypothetical protein EV360DRAFT_72858 [Lentinula raphanica]
MKAICTIRTLNVQSEGLCRAFGMYRHDRFGLPNFKFSRLENIFEYCRERSNRRSNVLVCKTWLDPCLNVIWRELNDLTDLVRLLGPTTTKGMVLEFVQEDVPLKWDRFLFYARRVRKIYQEGQDAQMYPKYALESVFAHIAYQRPSNILELCPNLKVLEWCGDTHYHMINPSILFMGPSLERYILNEDKPSRIHLAFVLRAVADRCPNLKHMKLSLQEAANPSYVDIIRKFIENMRVLHSVDLPPFADMSSLISTLRSYQPGLRNLRIQGCYNVNGRVDKPRITSLALPSPSSNGFASLTLINIFAPYAMVKELLENGFPFLQQISVTSDLRVPEAPSAVKSLIETLAKECPRINRVYLSYDYLRAREYVRLPHADSIVAMDHIRPLLKCTKMRHFDFRHPFPITLDDISAEEIATSWPELLQLHLSNDRAQAVFHLAKDPDIQTLPAPFFSKLRGLNVGTSLLYERDKHQVAQTLSRILPAPSDLLFDEYTIADEVDDADSNTDEEESAIPLGSDGWSSVMCIISFMRWVDKATKLEQHDLRSQNQELEAENERPWTQIQHFHA